MKKFATLALTVALTFSSTLPVFAADNGDGGGVIFDPVEELQETPTPTSSFTGDEDGGILEKLQGLLRGRRDKVNSERSDTETPEATEGTADTATVDQVEHRRSLAREYSTLAEALFDQWGSLDKGVDLKTRELTYKDLQSKGFFGEVQLNKIDFRRFEKAELGAVEFLNKGGLDGAISKQAAQWAAEIGKLNVPELTEFKIGDLYVPTEAVSFGIAYTEALKVTSFDFKDWEKRREQVTGDAFMKEWRNRMNDATQTVNRTLGSAMPCQAAFLTALTGGKAATDRAGYSQDCNACVVAGVYSKGLFERLVIPDIDQVIRNTEDKWLSDSELDEISTRANTQFWDLSSLKKDVTGLTDSLSRSGITSLNDFGKRPAESDRLSDCAATRQRATSSVNRVTSDVASRIWERRGDVGR